MSQHTSRNAELLLEENTPPLVPGAEKSNFFYFF